MIERTSSGAKGTGSQSALAVKWSQCDDAVDDGDSVRCNACNHVAIVLSAVCFAHVSSLQIILILAMIMEAILADVSE